MELADRFIGETAVNLFLTGRAGTGKTTFLHRLRERSPKRMIVVAPTGVAAINAGGVTIHSFFQLAFAPYIPESVRGVNPQNRQEQFRFNKQKIAIIRSIDLLVIDEMGDFHILPRGKENQQNGISTLQNEHEIVNCFFFGPALVVDGEVQGADTYDQYAFDPTQPNPRAAIGQIGPLTYAVVVVNGRTSDTVGVTMEQLATIMGDIGCQQAYNLDGGNSATLVFHNEIYSAKENKERSVSDIIYFASAIGE